jgi:hypothetical protein
VPFIDQRRSPHTDDGRVWSTRVAVAVRAECEDDHVEQALQVALGDLTVVHDAL